MIHQIILLILQITLINCLKILVPNSKQGWTNEGNQTLIWETIETDPLNFTLVLSNPDSSVFIGGNFQVLQSLVESKLKNISVPPPSAGWPVGTNFQLNFDESPEHLNTVYTTSESFEIKNNSTNSSMTIK